MTTKLGEKIIMTTKASEGSLSPDVIDAVLHGLRVVAGGLDPSAKKKISAADVVIAASAALRRKPTPEEHSQIALLSVGGCEQWFRASGDLRRLNTEDLRRWFRTRTGKG